ncbi:MAG: alpha/beta hydrolase [Magnetococcales bacterium]|nr:alpha/beta hydrolase [Magnetococcales bacterium]
MDNNVTAHLASGLARQGMVVFRFNPQGVGRSETDRNIDEDQQLFWEHSTAPEYEKAMETDTGRAFEFFTGINGKHENVHIIGYSYGCLGAIRLPQQASWIERMVLIAPPLARWPMPPPYPEGGHSTALIWAEDDFACPSDLARNLFDRLPPPKVFQVLPAGLDHFLVGHEVWLSEWVGRFLQGR